MVAYHWIRLGYVLDLAKSTLTPRKVVPYLGWLVDSSNEVFRLLLEKKQKFIQLIRETLEGQYENVKTPQRLVSKCTSFSLALSAGGLFTKEINISAISCGQRTQRPVAVRGLLREISY